VAEPLKNTQNNILLTDLFLHSCEAEFVQELRKGEKKLAQS